VLTNVFDLVEEQEEGMPRGIPVAMSLTVMWPAFAVKAEEMAAVLPGAILDRAAYVNLQDVSIMALRPKDKSTPEVE
jgi:homoserine kinase